MIVFTHTITTRLTYIANYIGKEITRDAFHLTDSVDKFTGYSGPKINYSNERIAPGELWLQPHTLLFEKDIRQQNTGCFEVNNNKAFFKTDGDLPFDIFAASFYLMSRYEEYLTHNKDMYGRYAYKNSLAVKENFLHLPLINIWVNDLINVLRGRFPSFTIHHSPFTFLPTYDIDEAWSYKHKGWQRITGASIKNLFSGNWSKILERKRVLMRMTGDPYDAYDWMDKLHEVHNLKPLYFFLVPEKTGKYDKSILPKEKAFQKLICQHSDKYTIGVHPSWQSGDDPSLIKKEKDTIERITGKTIISSRQHFIRFNLPQTYRHLMDAGIKEDFSMGYGSINGFRASVASSFFWYDLEKEAITNLILYPFCFMDANSFFEQKYSPQQALEEMRQYHSVVRSVNGTFIPIWHNTFLGTDKKFKGWKEMYEKFIKEVGVQAEKKITT